MAVIPFAAVLYREHFAVLSFFRPTKEVLLAGGFLARRGDVALAVVIPVALPILILGVWLFYFLGRAFAETNGLKRISVADLIAYRQSREKLVERIAHFPVETAWGPFTGYAYTTPFDPVQHEEAQVRREFRALRNPVRDEARRHDDEHWPVEAP